MLVMREDLLSSDEYCHFSCKHFLTNSPNAEYLTVKKWPKLDAELILHVALIVVNSTPPDLYKEVVTHPFLLDSFQPESPTASHRARAQTPMPNPPKSRHSRQHSS